MAGTVVIHHLVTLNTIDERILAALARKDRTQESLIAAVRAQIPSKGISTEAEQRDAVLYCSGKGA